MAVKKLFGNVYYADYRDLRGIRRRVSLQTQDPQVAQAKYEKIIQARDAEKNRRENSMPWEQFKDKVLEHLAKERSANTVKRTEIAIRYLEEVYYPRVVCEVTPKLLQQVKEHMLEQGLGEHNINRLLQCLKTMMRLGEEWKIVEWQNWCSISKLKAPKKDIEVHSEEELTKLLNACPTDDWRTLVLLGAEAGLRREEISNLRWSDVDTKDGMLYVDSPKDEHIRTIPMTDLLKSHLAKVQKKAASDFVISEGRDNPNKDFLTINYGRIAKEAGLHSTMQKLRDTFACRLLQKGMQLDTLAKLMGNSLEMALKYNAFLKEPDDLNARVVQALSRNHYN